MAVPDGFEEFWTAYPRRIGKLAAMKAYRKARTMASAQEILDGIARYKAAKPSYADFCFPATFLNQGRWLDEADAVPSYDWICPHVPHCPHRAACAIVAMRKP